MRKRDAGLMLRANRKALYGSMHPKVVVLRAAGLELAIQLLALPSHCSRVHTKVCSSLSRVRRDLALARRLLLAAVLDVHRVDIQRAFAMLRAGCKPACVSWGGHMCIGVEHMCELGWARAQCVLCS